MDNFFYNESDFELFKKALKISENEPVIINILKDDESLKPKSTDTFLEENRVSRVLPERRKDEFASRSSSPFSKYFSPRKSSNKPIDISNFANWRNKNYRNIEKSLDKDDSLDDGFSLSDYFAERTQGKTFNHSDQITTDMQKPLNELSVDDEKYKRFSLDSYLQKLERQSEVEGDFEKSGDLLEPLGNINQDEEADTFNKHDESFEDTTKFDFDEVINDDENYGEKYSFDKTKLDTVKERIDKKREEEEYEAPDEVEETEQDEKLEDGDYIDFDDEDESTEQNNKNLSESSASKDEIGNDESTAEIDVGGVVDEVVGRSQKQEDSDNVEEISSEKRVSEPDSSPSGFRNFNEFRKSVVTTETHDFVDQNKDDDSAEKKTNEEINSNLVDIIDKKTEENLVVLKRLKDVENEKNIQKEQYEEHIKHLEDDMKLQKEESEKNAYLGKLKFDEDIRTIEESNKQREIEIREEEREKFKLKQLGENLSKELKNNLESSNLEMDKKYFETVLKTQEKTVKKTESTSSARKKKKKTRRLDSDIIGSIDIE